MNSCKHCGVLVISKNDKCPLCSNRLESVEEAFTPVVDYPPYLSSRLKQKTFTLSRILLFLATTASILSVFINILTADKVLFSWSVIVSFSLFSVFGIYKALASKKLPIGSKLMVIYAISAVLLVAIDVTTGFLKWSTTYVVPFLTVALTVFFSIIASSKRKRFSEYMGYLITTFFLSFIPLLLFAFKLCTEIWSSLVALLCAIIAALGMLIFSDDAFKLEIKKRFHL